MKELRILSIIISAIFITFLTLGAFYIALTSAKVDTWSMLVLAGIDLYFIGIIWFLGHFNNSKHRIAIIWVAFVLSVLPVLAIFYIISMISHMHC